MVKTQQKRLMTIPRQCGTYTLHFFKGNGTFPQSMAVLVGKYMKIWEHHL